VAFAKQVKYLGVLLHASLKDDNHNQRQMKSLYRPANKLRDKWRSQTKILGWPKCLILGE